MFNTNLETKFDDIFGIYGNTTKLHKQIKDKDTTTLYVDVAGYNPEDVNVEVDGNTLQISVDKELVNPLKDGLTLKFTVNPTTSPKPISAEIKNGLLTLVFSKLKPSKDKKIKVTF